MSDQVLNIKNLAIGYKSNKKTVVIKKSIDFHVRKGELIGVIGPNGIGKSTLLKTISGNLSPINGEIEYNARPKSNYSALELSKIMSLVLTNQLISKNLTVKELIALGRQPYTNWLDKLNKSDIEQIDKAIQQANLVEIIDHKCYELSDGQMQKTLLARAIAQNTDLIVLDEPTTHLDIYHKAYIMKLLRELATNDNKAILFATHEIELSIQLCDYLIVMTSDILSFDTPKNHISNGVFNDLFPKDLIDFDRETKRFRIKD